MFSKKNEAAFSGQTVKNHFLKVLNLVFKLNVTSERTWVIILLLPTFLSFVVIFSFSKYAILYRMLPPQLLATILITPLITGFIFALNIIEWRQTYILRRLKTIGVKPWQILVASLIVSTLFLAAGTLFNLLVNYLFSLVVVQIDFDYLANLTFYNWIWFILVELVTTTIFFLLSLLITNFINKKNTGIIILFLCLIFFGLFSDIIIPSFISANHAFFNYISYLSIIKYCSWILLLTASFAFIDYRGGIKQVTQTEGNNPEYIFLNNIYVPIVIVLVASGLLLFFTAKYFKWKD